MNKNLLTSALVASAVAAVICLLCQGGWTAEKAGRQQDPSSATVESAALKAEIDRLKGIVPDQAHAMKDVSYHFNNLWFAGQKENWPLAEFYWNETRSHLRWAMRIIPVRKDPQGNEIRVADMLTAIESTSLEPLLSAIKDENQTKFADGYQQMLAGCYSCHVAAGKPFLRLQMPTQPADPMIQFEPAP